MKVEWRADDKLVDDSVDFNNLKGNCQWFLWVFQFNGIVGVIISIKYNSLWFIHHTWILQGNGMQFITYAWDQIGFFLWNLCKEFPQFHVNSFNNEVLYRYLSITIYCNIHYGDQAFIFYVEWKGVFL